MMVRPPPGQMQFGGCSMDRLCIVYTLCTETVTLMTCYHGSCLRCGHGTASYAEVLALCHYHVVTATCGHALPRWYCTDCHQQ